MLGINKGEKKKKETVKCKVKRNIQNSILYPF